MWVMRSHSSRWRVSTEPPVCDVPSGHAVLKFGTPSFSTPLGGWVAANFAKWLRSSMCVQRQLQMEARVLKAKGVSAMLCTVPTLGCQLQMRGEGFKHEIVQFWNILENLVADECWNCTIIFLLFISDWLPACNSARYCSGVWLCD